MDISKNMKESKPIQRKAADIIEKWSRIVWDINTNYSDVDSENRMYKEMCNNGKKRRVDESDDESEGNKNSDNDSLNENGEKKQKEEPVKKEPDIYSHARIPKRALFDFMKKPVSNLSDSKNDDTVKSRYNFFDQKKIVGGRKKKET